MTIPRHYTLHASSSSSTSSPIPLPGLISSLKPIKRLTSQLAEESLLLRRFTYKNKNQHKANGWWRKIVEVDRVMSRLGDELEGLLGGFGVGRESEESAKIGREELLDGVVRIPRVMMLVDKTLDILLKSASILEQLLHSRAFLPFAVVVVALTARLHALSTVLREDLERTAGVLIKLVQINELLPTYEQRRRNLSRTLQIYLPTHLVYANLTTAVTTTPREDSFTTAPPLSDTTDAEIGSLVSRPSLTSLSSAPNQLKPHDSPSTTARNDLPVPSKSERKLEGTSKVGKKLLERPLCHQLTTSLPHSGTSDSTTVDQSRRKVVRGDAEVEVRNAGREDSIGAISIAKEVGQGVERERKGTAGKRVAVGGEVKKKKKKKKQGGDEIDDIFG